MMGIEQLKNRKLTPNLKQQELSFYWDIIQKRHDPSILCHIPWYHTLDKNLRAKITEVYTQTCNQIDYKANTHSFPLSFWRDGDWNERITSPFNFLNSGDCYPSSQRGDHFGPKPRTKFITINIIDMLLLVKLIRVNYKLPPIW